MSYKGSRKAGVFKVGNGGLRGRSESPSPLGSRFQQNHQQYQPCWGRSQPPTAPLQYSPRGHHHSSSTTSLLTAAGKPPLNPRAFSPLIPRRPRPQIVAPIPRVLVIPRVESFRSRSLDTGLDNNDDDDDAVTVVLDDEEREEEDEEEEKMTRLRSKSLDTGLDDDNQDKLPTVDTEEEEEENFEEEQRRLRAKSLDTGLEEPTMTEMKSVAVASDELPSPLKLIMDVELEKKKVVLGGLHQQAPSATLPSEFKKNNKNIKKKKKENFMDRCVNRVKTKLKL
ncbi:unnamed protein product [Notodromas monacha]|uniref:Uncharacterized protein n=1 Tax=Notodromas monacha TaxID=399045 RepID=A0A7R9BRC2_9CRUS|nr:unnamed protein product [Notodromas monacha]CAG0918905.1 unnamed protein product [Notodromas monacha]